MGGSEDRKQFNEQEKDLRTSIEGKTIHIWTEAQKPLMLGLFANFFRKAYVNIT